MLPPAGSGHPFDRAPSAPAPRAPERPPPTTARPGPAAIEQDRPAPRPPLQSRRAGADRPDPPLATAAGRSRLRRRLDPSPEVARAERVERPIRAPGYRGRPFHDPTGPARAAGLEGSGRLAGERPDPGAFATVRGPACPAAPSRACARVSLGASPERRGGRRPTTGTEGRRPYRAPVQGCRKRPLGRLPVAASPDVARPAALGREASEPRLWTGPKGLHRAGDARSASPRPASTGGRAGSRARVDAGSIARGAPSRASGSPRPLGSPRVHGTPQDRPPQHARPRVRRAPAAAAPGHPAKRPCRAARGVLRAGPLGRARPA